MDAYLRPLVSCHPPMVTIRQKNLVLPSKTQNQFNKYLSPLCFDDLLQTKTRR